ncbi:non-lysosomal glucosylceramidase-like [Diadema setosum]|uniref:non-lysosomal glucosylceramidase-like n=1 Tax=Diadema setosum TaxID=31175 RepID=UPI003B3B7557
MAESASSLSGASDYRTDGQVAHNNSASLRSSPDKHAAKNFELLEQLRIPRYCWTVTLNHKFQEKWRPLTMVRPNQIKAFILPSVRYSQMHFKMWRGGKRPFIDVLHPVKFRPIFGVPIGGIGCGAINRGWKGDFCRWSLKPGKYSYHTVDLNQFTVCVRRGGKTVYQQVLSPNKPSNKELAHSWEWQFPANRASYHGLYPRAWTKYLLPGQNITLVCRQVSPIFPHNYQETSLPVGVFVWDVYNNGSEAADVSLMFTWQNGTGESEDKKGGRWNTGFSSASTSGVMFHDGHPTQPCTVCIAAACKDGVNVTTCSSFDPSSQLKEIWNDLKTDGQLNTTKGPSERTEKGHRIAGAVAASCHVEAGKKEVLEFSLSWDMPKVHFDDVTHLYFRRYTRWFGRDGTASPALCSHALEEYPEWEKEITAWQDPILNDETLPDWYKSALFNELYFITDGGGIWVDIDEEFPNGTTNQHTRAAPLVQEYGRFAYLEGHEYRMYNTYDVHFYASFALIMLWPKLELSLQYDIGHYIDHRDDAAFKDLTSGLRSIRKSPGCVPHDIGNPEEEPWLSLNCYWFHDTAEWKDLNLKFVLMTYRDYYATKDKEFLEFMWPKCKTVMAKAKSQDKDGDGLIDHEGTADQTYDAWTSKGVSAYCGGLYLAALRCACEMGELLGDQAAVREFSEILERGKASYEKKLWNGKYYNYDSSDQSYHDSIMADQTCGHWYLRACDLVPDGGPASPPSPATARGQVFPVDHVRSALRTIFDMNVMQTKGGNFGAMNGMRPSGKADHTSLQGEEVWVGTTYGLAGNMIQEGMWEEGFRTARGCYITCYEQAGLAYQVPEAYMAKKIYRSLGYMRPLAIWAMQWAVEKRKKQQQEMQQ